MPIDRGMDKKRYGTYIQWNISHKKEWNSTICSNMDGPGDYHTEWSESERGRQISYDTTYMQNLKKKIIQMNLFTKQKQTHSLREQTYGYQGKRMGGRDKLGVWNWHIHTATFKIDKQGDFPGGSVVKNLPANAGYPGSIPGPGRSHMLRSN